MAVSYPPHIAETRVQTQNIARKIYCGQSGTEPGSFLHVTAAPVSIIPQIFRTHLHLITTFTRRSDQKYRWGETQEPSNKTMLFRRLESIWPKSAFTLFSVSNNEHCDQGSLQNPLILEQILSWLNIDIGIKIEPLEF